MRKHNPRKSGLRLLVEGIANTMEPVHEEYRYMSDEDIAAQYKGWWFSEFGPVERDGVKKDANAWIEFPSADDVDFDSGRGLWFIRRRGGEIIENNDVWMEPATRSEVLDAARCLIDKNVGYLSFGSRDEFMAYMRKRCPNSLVVRYSQPRRREIVRNGLYVQESDGDGSKVKTVEEAWRRREQIDAEIADAKAEAAEHRKKLGEVDRRIKALKRERDELDRGFLQPDMFGGK